MIKLIDILTEITEDKEIKSIEYYQQLLNISNGLSQSTAKYFQDVINSVKKKNGKATEKQWNIEIAQDPFLGAPEEPAPTPEEASGIVGTDTAKKLIFDTKGKFFTVTFIKKDGTERTMNARLQVKKYLKGGELKYSPSEMGYIPVYDMQSKGYRMVNTNTIKTLKIGKKIYT